MHYHLSMTRREIVAAASAAAFAARLRARGHWDKSRISAITDEIGTSTDESIAFAHQYGLQFVELRNPPGNKKEYFALTEPEIKADAVRFQKEGLKISFLNTSLLKFTWPGSEPAHQRPEDPDVREKRLAAEKARWDRRMDDLHLIIRCAQIMGCDKARVFTGERVADPKTMYQRIADAIGEMALTAEREKIYLLIENESTQNIGTSPELADIMKLIPSKWVGYNWDPFNAYQYNKEIAYPDGYNALPKSRMLNIQVKARGVMPDSPEKEDWKGIMVALEKDGYKGKIGLETHTPMSTRIQDAHASMEEILRIVNEV
jgi:sugar phosphate isomerase/epimerase